MQAERAVRKAKRVDPPKGKGPLAPKPSGVFATPDRAPSVTDKPVARAKVSKPTPAVLDVLPTRKGQNSKPYTPPVAKTVVRKAKRVRVAAQAEAKDTKGDADRQRAQAYLDAHPEILHPKKPSKGGGSILASITGAGALGLKGVSKLAPYGAAVMAPAVTATLAGVDAATGSHTRKYASELISNAPKDLAELVTTTPTSLVKLGDTAVHDPEKVPGLLAQPYKDLAAHPGEFIKTHPFSTALMLDPAVKVPGKVAGKGLRLAGKQTLERTPATLPGSVLKETRSGSRDAMVNAVQKRVDRKNPAPQMTVTSPRIVGRGDVERRVDEFHDFAKQKIQQIQAGAHRTAEQRHAALPKDQRKIAIAADVEGARAGARKTIDQRFVKEFGSPWQRHSSGAIVKPKQATEGHLHTTMADAKAVAQSLNANPKITTEFKVMPAGKKFGVVPAVARQRLLEHRVVGTSKATMSKVMRRSRGALTQAVLPLSTKWLMGQGVEAGVRSVAAGAGPADLLRFKSVVKKLNADKPGAGDELIMRVSGGQFGLTGTAREFAQGQRSLADEFAGTSLKNIGNAATRAGASLPLRTVRRGWGKYTNVVLDSINGVLENNARKAMAGQAIRDSPAMQKHVVGLSEKAIDDAAKGLTGTESQVALGRAVDRMYGQYQKFSPEKRSLLLHWTPFLPWYLNTAKFLFKVLPADHPIKSALVADVDAATEQWREDHGLSLRGGDTKPDWMLGGYPTKAGIIPVGKFTPFGIGTDVPGAVASLTLPQMLGPIKNAGGVSWNWKELRNQDHTPFTHSQNALRALVTAVESQVPGVSQALRVSGAERKYVDRKPVDDSAKQTLSRLLNPLAPIPKTGEASSASGPVRLPEGVSASELRQLVKDAQAAQAQPQVSASELKQLIKEQLGG